MLDLAEQSTHDAVRPAERNSKGRKSHPRLKRRLAGHVISKQRITVTPRSIWRCFKSVVVRCRGVSHFRTSVNLMATSLQPHTRRRGARAPKREAQGGRPPWAPRARTQGVHPGRMGGRTPWAQGGRCAPCGQRRVNTVGAYPCVPEWLRPAGGGGTVVPALRVWDEVPPPLASTRTNPGTGDRFAGFGFGLASLSS